MSDRALAGWVNENPIAATCCFEGSVRTRLSLKILEHVDCAQGLEKTTPAPETKLIRIRSAGFDISTLVHQAGSSDILQRRVAYLPRTQGQDICLLKLLDGLLIQHREKRCPVLVDIRFPKPV